MRPSHDDASWWRGGGAVDEARGHHDVAGRPVAPLVSWQDQRGAARAAEIADKGHSDLVRRRTGLPLDPMFSAVKMAALLDEHDPARDRSGKGQLRLGTVDAWLLTRLTGRFGTEIGNAHPAQIAEQIYR